MFRIDDPTAATSLPVPEAAGTEGYYTEGNPTAGTPATNVRGSWLNMIQEELRAVVVAGGLTPSKTIYTQVRDAIKAMVGPGRLLGIQVFTASGTYTPGNYNGVTATKIRVRGIGGGGAGGSIAFTSTGQAAVAGGGNGGAPGEIMILGSLAASYPVVIGSAGSPGAQGNNPGGAGGTTTFGGTLLTCAGGQGGLGGAAATPPVAIFGNGLINQATSASPAIAVVLGATPIGDLGAAFSVSSALGGKGASTPYGAGGNGGGGGNGSTGKGYGAGGGGAGQGASSGTGFQGGSGLSGILIVEEYA
ncbi:hypothetical protein NK8_12940 [Caballeronia sp. NK8]|uniref:hypothetical protein n=1 Tax=Caballeronia sp. NK8 TaxID=140098 RepID=UPI001BB4E2E6|nr:hypothetical protein [Caballeronia sp. NK8]BCQ23169.1 hypothetical protein NK8_12940 [Caballeronia sp. NK8]